MKGLLRVTDEHGEREVELPRGRSTIGSSPSDTIRLSGESSVPSAITLHWEPRRGTWMIRSSASSPAEVFVSGRRATPDAYLPLGAHECILVGATPIYFERVSAVPIYRGQQVNRVVLTGSAITIGREDPGRSRDPARVDLDAEETTISRNHAIIERRGDEYFLIDLSRSGTELNGVGFTKERLVFGDRFRISGYIFEFTDDAIQLVNPEASGSLAAKHLTVVTDGRTIMDDVSFGVRAGEFIGVLGGTGQGESSLLKALCGISPMTSGDIEIGGISIRDGESLRAIGVGFVPRQEIVHPELTVRDAITFSARLRLRLPPNEICAVVSRVTNRLGLAEQSQKCVADLLPGQRKRVSIAIELLAKPNVLFLDEPTSGLDPATEEALMTLLQSLTLTKLTIIATTHVLQKAYLFDRILFIHGGKLIFAGNIDEARQHFLPHEDERRGSLYHSSIERIYSRLANEPKAVKDWEHEYRSSQFSARAVASLPARATRVMRDECSNRLRTPSALMQSWLLGWRQLKILRSDLSHVSFVLLQPLLLGFLIAWIADNWTLRMFLCVIAAMWFGCGNAAQQIVGELPIFRRERLSGQGLNTYIASKITFWAVVSSMQALLLFMLTLLTTPIFHRESGDRDQLFKEFVSRLDQSPSPEAASSENVQTIVADSREREVPAPPPNRNSAVSANSALRRYFHSMKVWGYFTTAELFQFSQNVIDSGERTPTGADGTAIRDAHGRPVTIAAIPLAQIYAVCLGLRVVALTVAALIGVAIGLAISSLVRNTTQAILLVSLTLISQILLGGIVVTVPAMQASVRALSAMLPSFAVQRSMEASGLFGLATPLLTNRTKIPVFLTSRGEKEQISWIEDGRSYSQTYDKVSPVNTAWQNIAVISERLGQHKQAIPPISESLYFQYRDVAESRRDVRFSKGTVVRSLSAFGTSALIAVCWIGLCYTVILLGLSRKLNGP